MKEEIAPHLLAAAIGARKLPLLQKAVNEAISNYRA